MGTKQTATSLPPSVCPCCRLRHYQQVLGLRLQPLAEALLSLALARALLFLAEQIGIPLKHRSGLVASHFHAIFRGASGFPHLMRGRAAEIVEDAPHVLRTVRLRSALRTGALSVQNRVVIALFVAAVTAEELPKAVDDAGRLPAEKRAGRRTGELPPYSPAAWSRASSRGCSPHQRLSNGHLSVYRVAAASPGNERFRGNTVARLRPRAHHRHHIE